MILRTVSQGCCVGEAKFQIKRILVIESPNRMSWPLGPSAIVIDESVAATAESVDIAEHDESYFAW